jgi:type I restriction enzyme S subunit
MDDLKETAVPWLRRIPADWTVSKVKWQFDVQLGKMLDEDTITGEELAPYLRNKDVQWWDIHTEDLPEMDFSPAEKRKYNLQSGDILVCEGGEIGRSAVWTDNDVECYYQKALHRVRPVSDNQDSRFFCYFMEFAAENGLFVANTNRSTIDHLTAIKLKNQEIPVPPSEEQEQIVGFLDHHTARIDTLVEKQNRLLDLLNEKRQAVITQTVTRGLDSTVATKSTDVEWLGDIPEHWDAVRTRFVARLESGHTPSKSNDDYWTDTDIPWVTTSDIKHFRGSRKVYLEDTEYEISELGLQNSGARLLPEGTVFLSRTASVGFSGIMAKEMATSQDFANWVCGDEIIPEYLLYVFRSMDQEFDRLMQGSTHQTIYMPEISTFQTPLPPVEEQREIVAYIQDETEHLWNLIDGVERSIDLLEEKRQALITAAVTGQIDVTEEHGEIQDSPV